MRREQGDTPGAYVEEGSFVAKGAPLDDGQKRVSGDGRSAAEPDGGEETARGTAKQKAKGNSPAGRRPLQKQNLRVSARVVLAPLRNWRA